MICSVPEAHIPVPFVRERFRHDLWRVRAVFAPYRQDCAFIHTLADEVTGWIGSVPRALPYPDGVIDAGERAIAEDMIEVARALPEPFELTFDMHEPSAPHGWDAVTFANQSVATAFLAVALRATGDQVAVVRTMQNRTALGVALEHPAGQRYAGVVANQPAADRFVALPNGIAELVERGATLLARRYLALLPCDPSRRRLRLVWLDHQMPSLPTAVAPPAPARAARAVPPPPAGPKSVLPEQSQDLSEHTQMQVRALIEAASYGAMGCEICAQRALRRVGV